MRRWATSRSIHKRSNLWIKQHLSWRCEVSYLLLHLCFYEFNLCYCIHKVFNKIRIFCTSHFYLYVLMKISVTFHWKYFNEYIVRIKLEGNSCTEYYCSVCERKVIRIIFRTMQLRYVTNSYMFGLWGDPFKDL